MKTAPESMPVALMTDGLTARTSAAAPLTRKLPPASSARTTSMRPAWSSWLAVLPIAAKMPATCSVTPASDPTGRVSVLDEL